MTVNNVYTRMIHKYDVKVFSIILHLEESLSKNQLYDFFELMEKIYPLYRYNDNNILNDNNTRENIKEVIISEIDKGELSYYDFSFDIPIFIQNENKIETIFSTEKGIGVTIEKDERFGFVFILDVFPDVYINSNSYPVFDNKNNKWIQIKTNQKKAALKNRSNLSLFLCKLEEILKSKIAGYESLKFNSNDIYKYGFLD